MGDTLKWPKDTAQIVKVRAREQQNMSKADAQLNMRLLVADDVQKLIDKEIGDAKKKSEMTCTLNMFRFAAEQAPGLVAKLKASGGSAATLTAFAGVFASKFGERGGNICYGSEEIFAANDSILFMYLQRGLVDFVTRWSQLDTGARSLFATAILDSGKNYPTTCEITEETLFFDGETLIQKWAPPENMSMDDVLESWLDGEANDSIYTGLARPGQRQSKREQLKNYVMETKVPDAYHCCWSSIVTKVVTKKDFSWSNHNEIIAFFRQNVPQITSAFKGMVPEPDVRGFVQDYLPKLLKDAVA